MNAATAACSFWDLLRQSGGSFEATISGISMQPTLAHGARVRIRPLAAADYRTGQIAACVLGGSEIFAHRIVHCTPRSPVIVTRGDNHVLCDPPTRKAGILGVIEAYWNGVEWVPPGPEVASRMPAVSVAHLRAIRACLCVHFEVARHVAGTTLHVARGLGRTRLRAALVIGRARREDA